MEVQNNLAKFIDHTLLKPSTSQAEIEKLCKEAAEHNFASVCVNPSYVKLAASLLTDSDVKVCTVVGFPLGANDSNVKAFETKNAIENGADEIDMVINIGALKSQKTDLVKEDISQVVQASNGLIVKVIIETALLTNDEKRLACSLSKEAKAQFVKTSTGFSGGGATIEDIQLMKEVVGDELEVKASGGIRDYETALKMIQAGATRLGTSSGTKLLKGETSKEAY